MSGSQPQISQIAGDRVLARGRAATDYVVRLANGPADIKAAQTLRFIVFNLELNEGLEHSYLTFRDADKFDEVCDHLVVEHTKSGEIIGTYRLQTGTAAAGALGYYSAQEFDMSCFDPVRSQTVELGRACVHSCHRNPAVLGMLWRGIANYARVHGARYLVGCSSVSSNDPAIGASVYFKLRERHLAPESFQANPLPHFVCPIDTRSGTPVKIPKLLTAYLSLGAWVCGPPAIDREFKTIDFLTLLDLEMLSPRVAERLL